MSNAYPRLSEAAYSDDLIHHREVIDMMVEAAADVWLYYKGKRFTEAVRAALKRSIKYDLRDDEGKILLERTQPDGLCRGKVIAWPPDAITHLTPEHEIKPDAIVEKKDEHC